MLPLAYARGSAEPPAIRRIEQDVTIRAVPIAISALI
jgi:hypothetical protein